MAMLKIFNSPFRVTQGFGLRPDYYKQFGLLGHEGVDLVPTTSDRAIFSMPYSGVVVLDIDMTDKGRAYGIHCTIWYPSINKAFMYCHLSENLVAMGEQLIPSTWIGVMGGTGNTQGDHLHLNQFEVDSNGTRLNRNNGFLGGVDPLPFINGNPPEIATPSTGGTVTMSPTVLISDVIKAIYRKMIGREIPSGDLTNEEAKTPFSVEDTIGRFMSQDFLKLYDLHTSAELIQIGKANYDQGYIDGKASVPQPQTTPPPTTGTPSKAPSVPNDSNSNLSSSTATPSLFQRFVEWLKQNGVI